MTTDGTEGTGSAGDIPGAPAAEPAPGLGIGTDEWVAQHATRMDSDRGMAGRIRATWARLPAPVQWGLPLVLLIVFPIVVSNGYLLRIGVNLGLFALLALGLNVVVGYAGLLDLGFVAFYGFGAYGYALLSSDQLGVHLATWASVPLVVAFTAGLGLLVSLPWAAQPVDITGGANGITGVSGWSLFGFTFGSNRSYYYLLLAIVTIVTVGLYRISRSRMGRAWRAIGEDSLAAEAMTIPVNRLKLLAFVVGAAIAGLTGTIFSAVQLGVYSSSFDVPLLILLYAAVILGGSGSLAGTLIGAAVMSLLPEILRQPQYSELLFFVVLILGLLKLLRPRMAALVVAGTVVVGFAINALLLAIGVPYLSAGQWAQGVVGHAMGRWLFVPVDRLAWGNVAFVLLIIAVALFSRMHGRAKLFVLPLLLWLAVFVWMVRLSTEPSLTRQLVIGSTLVVLMIARPQGLFGRQRVEVL